MVIVDSSVLIDLMASRDTRQTRWMRERQYAERFGLTSLIMCEVLQGLREETQVQTALELLLAFEVFEPDTLELAMASALNYRMLRRRGLTIRSTVDCLIATFCIRDGHSLLHRDRDFDAFETHLGLRVLHPPEPILH